MADGFWGREKEINDLVVDFQSVKNGQTRFVTIIGDTGIGKTRMVQEFYLSLCMKHDPSEYWPKNIGDTRHTMSIVPSFSNLDENRVHQMPWMWIGLRCQNSNERNSSTQLDSALNRSRQQIAMHLSGIFESRARKKQNAKIGKALITVLDFAFPGINFTTEVIKTILDFVSNGISLIDSVNDIKNTLLKKKGSNDRCERVLVQEKRSLVNQTMDVFAALFSLKEKSLPTIPLILVLDDAQWLDPITAEFLNRVLERGIKERWPLMVIATCWENSYKEQAAKEFSELSLPHICSGFESRGICRCVYLSKLLDKDVLAIIQNELPHIGVEAHNVLVEKCSGDLELLWEYIAKLKLTPGWISSDGTLRVSLYKVRGLSSKKKELAVERILNLDNGSVGQILTCGSAQGTQFDKLFIERCKQNIPSVEFNPEDLSLADNPYNLTRNVDRPIIGEIAEFRRFLYYEIAREFFEESPEKDQIQEVLMDFYQEMIETHIIDKIERNEQIRLYEEYLFW
ncbi:AAA family ATPase [Syntrophomonas palmitatica]|uniref:AAA family ATPase n=1 Tax=Syntrophomonas palmitatica TaxID=402877 RepID=UPI0006CFD82F|nr:ATP-binding protein [Syntrophomonas palmitatica]